MKKERKQLQRKIFRHTLFVSFAAIILTAALLLVGTYSIIEKNTLNDMRKETYFAAKGVNYFGFNEYLKSPFFNDTDYRITLIDSKGRVMYDNNFSNLPNHSDRPEFIEALKTGEGSDKRYSSTLEKTSFYCALKLDNGNVLRLANTQKSVFIGFLQILPLLIAILILATIASYFLGKRLTARVIKPINQLSNELGSNTDLVDCEYEEFSPFIQTINSQRREIKNQIETLTNDRDTISAITENMTEGLILLDSNENILALNKAAKEILNVKGRKFLGKNIINATRNEQIIQMAKNVVNGNYDETLLEQNSKLYEIHGCRVENNGESMGTVLFLVDVTSEESALKIRKEFTANVSHELKTPLTSISGYAEMIYNEMVDTKDIKEFSGKIYNECKRMISLVNDILTLSRLDEATEEIALEKFDVLDVVKSVSANLNSEAESLGVSIHVDGESASLNSSKSMVNQLMMNLMENAVKYNKHGGCVDINVQCEGDEVLISVKDTGVGIPEGDLDRIFERFYRVDKSRSKSIGGSGLGLSIVKHILIMLNGKIDLKSKENEGTEITVKLKSIN